MSTKRRLWFGWPIALAVGLTGEAYVSHTQFGTDLPTGSSTTTSANQYGLRFGLTAFIR